MRLVFTGYTGLMSRLTAADRKCLNGVDELFIDIPISKPHSPLSKDIDVRTNLVELLKETYPGVTSMHQYASESVKATGRYPVSTIVCTTEDRIDDNIDSDGSFLFDEQIIVKRKAAILKKPSVAVKESVGQFAP
jgi:hypothetical protein